MNRLDEPHNCRQRNEAYFAVTPAIAFSISATLYIALDSYIVDSRTT